MKEKPNFNLTGVEAQKDYDRFKLERVSIMRGRVFESENVFRTAEIKKLYPLIEEVSPGTKKLMEDFRLRENAIWGIWALWGATAFIRDSDGKISNLYWLGFGTTIGYSIYIDNRRSKFADQFNKDLKSKFRPGFAYNFEF